MSKMWNILDDTSGAVAARHQEYEKFVSTRYTALPHALLPSNLFRIFQT